MTLRGISLFALVVPCVLLLGALGFQYIGGLAPCELCMDQRWAHVFAGAMAFLALVFASQAKRFTGLAAAGLAISGGIAINHSGVERKWWSGPSSCSNSLDPNLSAEAYLKAIEEAAVVTCSDIPWSLAGLSMANYNGLLSLGAAALICGALWRLKSST